MKGLYDERFEHDACGIGAVINIKGKKEHKVIDDALKIVEKLEHRAGKDASGEVGDGVGIMTQISHDFFKKHSGFELLGERDYGVGMFFFPQDRLSRLVSETVGDDELDENELDMLSAAGENAVVSFERFRKTFIDPEAK